MKTAAGEWSKLAGRGGCDESTKLHEAQSGRRSGRVWRCVSTLARRSLRMLLRATGAVLPLRRNRLAGLLLDHAWRISCPRANPVESRRPASVPYESFSMASPRRISPPSNTRHNMPRRPHSSLRSPGRIASI